MIGTRLQQTVEAIEFLAKQDNKVNVVVVTVFAPGAYYRLRAGQADHTLIHFPHSRALRIVGAGGSEAIDLTSYDYYHVAFLTAEAPTKVYRMYGEAE